MVIVIVVVGALASLLIGEIYDDRVAAKNAREESDFYSRTKQKAAR